MHALILAGGKGTRLLPFTTTLPKPLMPIAGESAILEIVLRQLAGQGFRSATLAIGHLGSLIRAYVGDGSQWGIAVDYATEDQPLGTLGPALQIRERLPDHFLVMNGDVLTDLPFARLLGEHAASGAAITVSTCERELHVESGVLQIEDGRIVGFEEKPTLRFMISMGIYALSRTTLDRYTPGTHFGFDDLMLDLLERGETAATFPFDGYWLDIGRPEDYDRANQEFADRRSSLLPDT